MLAFACWFALAGNRSMPIIVGCVFGGVAVVCFVAAAIVVRKASFLGDLDLRGSPEEKIDWIKKHLGFTALVSAGILCAAVAAYCVYLGR